MTRKDRQDLSMKTAGYNFFATIRGRLALLLLAILIPILIVQIVIYRDRFTTLRRAELKSDLEMARAVAQTFQGLVNDILSQELSLGLALTSSQPLPREDVQRLLTGTKAAYPLLVDIAWINPAGQSVTASASRVTGIDSFNQRLFREAASDRGWSVSDLRLSGEAGLPVFTVSRAVRDPEGTLLGIVCATALADKLESVFPIEEYGEGEIVIIDSSGRAVIRSPKVDWTWESRNLLNRIPSVRKAFTGSEITETIVDAIDQKKDFFALVPIHSIGWAVGTARLERQALAPIFTQLRKHALLFSLVVCVSISVFFLIANSIANPLKRLQTHALSLGKGEPGTLRNFKGLHEFCNLGNALDFMARELTLKIEALAE